MGDKLLFGASVLLAYYCQFCLLNGMGVWTKAWRIRWVVIAIHVSIADAALIYLVGGWPILSVAVIIVTTTIGMLMLTGRSNGTRFKFRRPAVWS